MHPLFDTMLNLHSIKALILDMDGVLWRDADPIIDLSQAFTFIRSRGLGVVLATNNATRNIHQYLEKVSAFGVELEPWQIINSADATIAYLRTQFPQKGPIFILGSDALRNGLEEAGFFHQDNDVLAVVAGMDHQLNYDKLKKATMLIRAGAPFIGTNPDRTFPTPQGLTIGTGAILAAIQAATDTDPIICGKPEPIMYQLAMERLRTQPGETLVVGDRPETDIVGAQKLGCQTALVLSGVTSLEKALAWRPVPTLIEIDLSAVLAKLAS
jgi:4-nitrophenyl phosphatase